MNIGELKKRITILEFVEVRDEFGGIDGSWNVIATRWAKIEQNGGSEISDNNQVQAKQSTKIVMRYFDNLTEKNRISYNGKLYEIKSVSDVDTGHYMTIANCEELKDGV